MMSNEVLIPLIVVVAIVLFSLMWIAITSLLGRISGWRGLERIFPDHAEPPVETLRFQTARMGVVNFNNCMRFEICATGLRIAVFRLLGPFLKPLFVPWGQINAERANSPFMKLVTLNLGSQSEGTMIIREKTFDRIAATGRIRLG